MKVRLIADHPGEGNFPDFEAGTEVALKGECAHFVHWHACEIAGYGTYVPACYVRGGRLTRKYNPTELAQKAGDIVEVREIVYAWLLAVNEDGKTGWIPAESVVSAE